MPATSAYDDLPLWKQVIGPPLLFVVVVAGLMWHGAILIATAPFEYFRGR